MSIDDNHQNLSLIQQALEDHFDVISSTGDESVEELVADCEPHIILLDIMLTNKSGYDVCRSLREKGLVKNTFIIFISSLTSLNDKLRAYEVGGDDYICKPVDFAELEYKLEACEKRINNQQQLETQMEEVSQVAYASMQQSSELGVLIEFFTQSLSILDFDDLYLAVKAAVQKFQLNCVVEFRSEQSTKQYPPEHISQLESEILDLGKRAKRVVPFGRNVLFNSKQCSLLVKKMPGNEEDLGRICDHLAILLEIINNRVQFIQSEHNRLAERQKAIVALKAGIEDNFSQVSVELFQLEKQLDEVFERLQSSLKNQLLVFGVSKDFEDQINNILESTKDQFENIVEKSIDIDYKIRDIDHLLNNIK